MSAKITLVVDGKELKAYELTQESHIVGRKHEMSDLAIEHPSLSRKHFSIKKIGEAYQIEDLQSTSGTYVNGKKIQKYFLNDGDEVLAGIVDHAVGARLRVVRVEPEQNDLERIFLEVTKGEVQ